ncbi:MAG: FAD-dependent oxidoreductase [Polyangiaceae bacterium]
MKRVAITGGGPGGLFSAFLLQQKTSEDLDITVFEAEDRLGGKVWTRRLDTGPGLYEAGAAELYRYGEDPLWLLVSRHLGLSTVTMRGEAVSFEGRWLSSEADLARAFGEETARAVRRFRREARAARPFGAYYDGGWPADNHHRGAKKTFEDLLSKVRDPVARRYLEILVHSDTATEPHATSALYGIDNYLINEPDYCRLYSIEGGLDRLIDALARRLSAKISLGTRVTSVRRAEPFGYRLGLRRGEKTWAEDFDAVLVALPIHALRQVSFEGKELRRAMSRHVARYDDPAHYLRITALFEEPFWRPFFQGSYFILDAFGGCCVYDETERYPAGGRGVLSFLLSGSDALALSHLRDEELVSRAVAALPAEVRGAPESPRVLESHVHRFTGMVSARPGGRRLAGSKERHRPEPAEHAGLLLAGDYLFDSTINGAFDSADIASSMLLRHLGVPRRGMEIGELDDYLGSGEPYERAFSRAFDARHVVALIEAAWGASPPYRLLDAGSATGIALFAFEAAGVDAWGVEASWYAHARTPEDLRGRNVLGDVRALPFPDGHFDFAYETCLAMVPEYMLSHALSELRRVTRRGLLLGSLAFGGLAPEGESGARSRRSRAARVVTQLSAEAWGAHLVKAGFRAIEASPDRLARLWKAEAMAPRDRPVRPTSSTLRTWLWEVAPPGEERAVTSGGGRR